MSGIYHNKSQEDLHKLVEKHGTWSPAELIQQKDVQRLINYKKSDHRGCRRLLVGRLQWLRKRLTKFGLVKS